MYPLNFETECLCFIIFKANNLEANKIEKRLNFGSFLPLAHDQSSRESLACWRNPWQSWPFFWIAKSHLVDLLLMKVGDELAQIVVA